MKLTTVCVLTAALLLGAATSNAETKEACKYFANEFSFDAFGTYSKSFRDVENIFDHDWRHGDFGGGVGMNYFLTRYIGVGTDTFFKQKGEFFSNVSGSLLLRLPFGNSGFSPYIFGGGGRRFDPLSEWLFHGGLGLEYRFTRHFGIFMDGRYVLPDKTSDYTLVRSGLRFAF